MDSIYGPHKVEKAYSVYDFNFIYRVGNRVYADRFDENLFDECTPGIHYFLSKETAAAYAWTGWFRIKQHTFWANLQSQLLEEHKMHVGLRCQTLITDEFMKGE